jgi:hypothetical protein
MRRSHQVTEPLRPATNVQSRPARGRTRTDEVGARRAPVTPQALEADDPDRTGLPGVALRCSPLRATSARSTPGWIRTSGCCRRGAVLCPLSYGRASCKSLRQELNPHLGRTKGACLPLTLRRREWRRRESNPLFLGASEAPCRQSFVPMLRTWLGCGRVESNHHSRRRRGYSAGSSPHAQRPHMQGGRPASNRRLRGSHPRVLPATPRPPRARTTGLEPAASRLTSERSLSSELRPRS